MTLFRKRVPEVFQIEAAECGAASLCMILGYYGRYIDLTVMRHDCHISRDGSRLSYVMAAARKHGMNPTAYRSDPNLTGRKLPAIAFWNYAHFLVVEEITDKWVYMTDPAYGRRKVTKEEFARGFSGVVLELECTDKFEKCGKPYDPVAPMAKLLRSNVGVLVYLSFLTTMINIVGLILPAFTTLFVDYYLPYLSNAQVGNYFIAFTAVIVMQALLLFIRKHVNIRFRRIQSAGMTGNIVSKLLKLPVSYFGTRSHSTIDSHLNDINSFTDFVAARFVPLMLDLLFSLIYIALLFTYSVKVAVPTLLLIAFLVGMIVLLLKMSKTAVILASNMASEFYGSVVQNVRLYDTVKSVAMEDESFLDMMRKYSSWQSAVLTSKKIVAVVQAIPIAVPLLIQVFIITMGSVCVINGEMSIGDVLACQTIAMSVFAPIVMTISEFSSLQGQQVKIKAMEDIENEAPDISLQRGEGAEEIRLDGEIELKNVSFGYNTAIPPILKNISFHVPAGGSMAFVGSSGSGKSSVLKVIEGLYVPQEGEILFSGADQNDISRTAFADSVAVVSQTPYVFNGTVRENITLFDRRIDMHTITEAAKAACVFDAVESHSGGFNAVMSPNESSFSGGEVQRIMIARALVRKPSILIMDEATSALDTIVEEQIMKNIRGMGITLLIVAHRLSAIRDCDEIIVLKNGEITERGTHDELVARNGFYTELMSSEDNQ